MLLSKNKLTALLLLFSVTLSFRSFSQENHPKQVKILTYNVQFLPNFLVHIKHFPRKRAALIAEAVLRDSVDIVVFQEIFDAPARKTLIKEMRHEFPYMIGPRTNKPKSWKRGTGVMIMSRTSLTPLEKFHFSKCKGVDCLAKKGIMIVETEVKGQALQIFGTHLQADGKREMMELQHREFGAALKRHEKANVPQISLGDFNTLNTDTALYNNMIQSLQSEDGPISGELKNTFDHSKNDMNKYDDEMGVLDYILYKGNGIEPKSVTRRVIPYQKRWSKRNKDLSDHYALLATFEF